jgi:hypothetical protein
VGITVRGNNITVRCQVKISKATNYFHHLFYRIAQFNFRIVEFAGGENPFYENRENNIRQINKLTPDEKGYNIIKYKRYAAIILPSDVRSKSLKPPIIFTTSFTG